MKIEKLSRDNIKEFIWDMKLSDKKDLERNVNKSEFYGVKKDDVFCLGFDSLSFVDTIAIINYNPKLSEEDFYECIDFLEKSLVVENHLIIEINNEKYMNLLEEKYRCKEAVFSLGLDGNDVILEKIFCNNSMMKEELIEIEMKSIKYFSSNDVIVCNLARQNIQEEKTIFELHNNFVNFGVNYINFTVLPDNSLYFKELGYTCVKKSYVIRTDLF